MSEPTTKEVIKEQLEAKPETDRKEMIEVISEKRGINPGTASTQLSRVAKVTKTPDGRRIVLREELGVRVSTHSPTPESEGLDDFIIKEWSGVDYVPQNINGHTDLEVLETLYKNRNEPRHAGVGIYPLFEGETGCGKTMLQEWFCFKNDLPFIRFNLNGGTTYDDMVGMMGFREGGEVVWGDGLLSRAMKYGGFVLFDEANFCHQNILSVLHPVMDKGRLLVQTQNGGKVIKAHPDFFVVVCQNPEGDGYHGAKPSNSAFTDRTRKFKMGYSEEVEAKLIKSKRLLALAKALRTAKENGVINSPTSTRALMKFESTVELLGLSCATESFVSGYQADEQGAVKDALKTHVYDPRTDGQDAYDDILTQKVKDLR